MCFLNLRVGIIGLPQSKILGSNIRLGSNFGPKSQMHILFFCLRTLTSGIVILQVPKNAEDWDRQRYVHKTHYGYYSWPRKMQVYAASSTQPQLKRSLEDMCTPEQEIFKFFSRWVMEFLTRMYKISYILSSKQMSLNLRFSNFVTFSECLKIFYFVNL